MSTKARILAFLCLATFSFATTSVTGTLKRPDGTAVSSGVFVRFYLRGCSAGAPTVNGTAAFPSTGGVNQFYVDFAPNASGVISGTLYSTRDAAGTGNGEISCNGSQTNTWYGVVIYYNSRPTNEVPVHAKNTATLDITQLSPITATPVVTAPTGDTTYCRLDASNCGFTGTVTFNNANPAVTATYDLGSSSFKWRDGWFSRKITVPTLNNGGDLTLPTSADTLVARGTTDTLTNKTLTTPTITSPVINGTPSGTGIPTVTFKNGTGAGAYTTASTTFVDVDATNLSYTVTIPTGWKLAVTARCSLGVQTALVEVDVQLVDNGSQISVSRALPVVLNNTAPGDSTLLAVINGNGASHTVKMQFKTTNAADTANINNSSVFDGPQMMFVLTPSN